MIVNDSAWLWSLGTPGNIIETFQHVQICKLAVRPSKQYKNALFNRINIFLNNLHVGVNSVHIKSKFKFLYDDMLRYI